MTKQIFKKSASVLLFSAAFIGLLSGADSNAAGPDIFQLSYKPTDSRAGICKAVCGQRHTPFLGENLADGDPKCLCKLGATSTCYYVEFKPTQQLHRVTATTDTALCTPGHVGTSPSTPIIGAPPVREVSAPTINEGNLLERAYLDHNKRLEAEKNSAEKIEHSQKLGALEGQIKNGSSSKSPDQVKALVVEKEIVEQEVKVHSAEVAYIKTERDYTLADAYETKAGNPVAQKKVETTAREWGVSKDELDVAKQASNRETAKDYLEEQRQELSRRNGVCDETAGCRRGSSGSEDGEALAARSRPDGTSGDEAGAALDARGRASGGGAGDNEAGGGSAGDPSKSGKGSANYAGTDPSKRQDVNADGKSEKSNSERKGPAVQAQDGECSGAVMAEMARLSGADAKKAGVSTRAGYEEYMRKHGNKYADDARDKYNCESQEGWIDNTAAAGEALNVGVGITSQIAAASATSNTQKAYYENPSDAGKTHQTALKEMGTATKNTGKMQIGAGGAQLAISVFQLSRASAQKKRIKNLKSEAGKKAFETEDGSYSAEGLAAQMTSNNRAEVSGVDERNNEGKGNTAQSIAKMKQIEAKGDAAALKSVMTGGMNTVAGYLKYKEGQAMIDQANNMKDAIPVNPTSPLAPSSDDGYQGGTVAPPIVNSGSLQEEGFAQTAEEKEEEKLAGAPLPLPGGGGPGGNSGGLKDGQFSGGGFNGPVAGPAGTTSGGGGAGGGGGTSPSAGGADKPAGSDVVTGGGSGKFEGSGGVAFGGGGAGSKKNDDGTGMDINGLLAQFLPKKDEEGANGPSILEYGANSNGRSLAGDDQNNSGGVLGPNANLFSRISTTTMDYYKKGNLK